MINFSVFGYLMCIVKKGCVVNGEIIEFMWILDEGLDKLRVVEEF